MNLAAFGSENQLFWMLSLIASAILCVVALLDLARAIKSEKWPVAIGTVLTTHSFEDVESGATIAAVTYRYEVAGREYRGSRMRCKALLSRGELGDLTTALDYRVGRSARVAYDPTSPERCVLEPGTNLAVIAAPVVSGAFVAISIAQLWF